MALNSAALSAAMMTELKAQGFETSGPHAKQQPMCDALAKAIVDHFKANAVVNTAVTGSLGSGVGVGTVT